MPPAHILLGRFAFAGLLLVVLGACSDGKPTATDRAAMTVAGDDANADGVRDDVEAYIDQTASDPATRNAWRQYAKAAQVAMIDAGNAALSVTHAVERFRAIECLMARRPNDFPADFTELRARLLNTELRTNAYLQADGQVTANTPSLLPAEQWVSACTNP